jgi:SnoaL-like domain
MALAPLTETEVSQFVAQWYHALDIHIALEGFLVMVADEGIEFRFPEVTVTDKAGLTEWYHRVTNTFFDEIHTIKELAITVEGDSADVKLMVQWQESNWNAPAPKSERQTFLAGQTWKVKRSDKTGQPVVVVYIVDTFDPVGGSGTLPVKDAVPVQ